MLKNLKTWIAVVIAFFNFVKVVEAEPPFVLILGVTQDGGYPQVGCAKACCAPAWSNTSLKKWVVSFAVVDPVDKKWWLFEATPDLKEQLQYFKEMTGTQYAFLPDGIFITHAHIGHYSGLMQLGREVMNSKEVQVYVLPKMAQFLTTNGPWSQLVSLKNIKLQNVAPGTSLKLTENVEVTAFTVPHRDEFSETAGYKIKTSAKSYLFIPDIDKWEKWDKDIRKEVEDVDIAFLDATFGTALELPGRDIKEVPHPFVEETVKLFQQAESKTRKKIYFIHFNHTNPLLWDKEARRKIQNQGFNITTQGSRL